jgi:hypothetical protein
MSSNDTTVVEIGTGSAGRGRHAGTRRLRAVESAPVEIPLRIVSGLSDATVLRREVPLPDSEAAPEVWAAWSARLALSHARSAGWWGVLARWTIRQSDFPLLYASAARTAQRGERDRAKHWQQRAQEWQARAAVMAGGAR